MQVITIGADGSVSGLQVKPGKGLDLTKLGHAEVERVSEILWDADRQAWYVHPIKGPMAGKSLTQGMWASERLQLLPDGLILPTKDKEASADWDDILFFDNYDNAVKAEVAYLDALRLKGQF